MLDPFRLLHPVVVLPADADTAVPRVGSRAGLALGVMSGTSLDGIDFALIAVRSDALPPRADGRRRRRLPPPLVSVEGVFATETAPLPAPLAAAIAALLRPRDDGSSAATTDAVLQRVCLLHTQWAEAVAAAAGAFIERALAAALGSGALCGDALAAAVALVRRVVVIGSHGQTVWHEGRGGTLQLGDGDVLARRVGCAVVSNFRAGDVAVGGTGAPLVPHFDRLLARGLRARRAAGVAPPSLPPRGAIGFQNLGGIANITVVYSDDSDGSDEDGSDNDAASGGCRRRKRAAVVAFDSGPANAVLNELVAQTPPSSAASDQRGMGASAASSDPRCHCDYDGCYSSLGTVDEPLLRRWRAHPFFAMAPPKSTGREAFGAAFVRSVLADDAAATAAGAAPPAPLTRGSQRFFDLCATAVALTVRTVAAAATDPAFFPRGPPRALFLSGGGARHPLVAGGLRTALAVHPPGDDGDDGGGGGGGGVSVALLSDVVRPRRCALAPLGSTRAQHALRAAGAAGVAVVDTGDGGRFAIVPVDGDGDLDFGDAKEAVAFAVLAFERVLSIFGPQDAAAPTTNEPSVTGATRRVALGMLSFP